MTSLKKFITRRYGARRRSPRRRQLCEDVGETRVISSRGLDAASVALPAGIDLEDRAARMNDFWQGARRISGPRRVRRRDVLG